MPQLDIASSRFLSRVTNKLRRLADLKTKFRDEVEGAVRRQASLFEKLQGVVSGAEDKVTGAVDFVRVVKEDAAEVERERLAELDELRMGAGRRLEKAEKEREELQAKERETELLKSETERLKKELGKTSGELKTLAEQYDLAQKAISASRLASNECRKRRSKEACF